MSLESEIIADSPVAFWKFAETSGTNANDEIATYDLTHTNGPVVNSGSLLPTGEGNSVKYDGGNDVSLYTGTPITSTTEFGFECIVKLSTTPGDYDRFFAIGANGTNGWDCGVLANRTIYVAAAGKAAYFSTATVSASASAHIAVARRTNGNAYIYINGVEESGALTTAHAYSGGNTAVGNSLAANIGIPAWIAFAALYATPPTAARFLAHYQAAFPKIPVFAHHMKQQGIQ